MTPFRLKRTDQNDPNFSALVKKLDEELAIRDGDDHAFYHQFNGVTTLNHVVVAFEKENAIGCGGFKQRSKTCVEIKRLYVAPSHRGQGAASQILRNLEHWARALNHLEIQLETGKAQVEALSFYPKMGYVVMPNFPPYEGVNNSICFRKRLV